MSNTLIQIKRSTTTQTPPNGSLSAGELAYSYLSDKLFAGNSSGTGVIEIGGLYYVNTAIQAFTKANTAYDISVLAYDKANAANLLAYNTGIGANAFAAATIAGANAAVGAGANAYANSVAAGANNYLLAVIAGANTAVGAGANAYANSVVGGSSNFANSTFVKLTASNQTITGNLSVVGSLTISGNTTIVNAENLRVSDPLIYLAGNNYSSDIVDIGFIGNYVNATGSNVHTGLYREHLDKMYYLFNGYDAEPINNHIGALSNNMTLAVLNADLRTSNLTLGGQNAISWITAAFDKANAANVLAYNTGIGANAYATAVGAGSNNYLLAVIAGANTAVGTGANAYAAALVGPAFNKANGAVQSGFVTISANGTSIVADSNNDTLTITTANGISIVGNATTDTIDFGLTTTGVTATTYGGAATVGRFTVDQFGRLTSAGNVAIAIDASAITSGILSVPRGGTGVGTFTSNGVLYGDGTNALKVTSAGTEGQVLQASAAGVPQFGMLDGGSF